MDYFAVGLARDLVQLFANRIACYSHTILVDQTRFAQLVHDDWNATSFVQVLSDVLAARLHVDEIRCFTEDVADVIKEEVDTSLVRHCRQVKASVGGTTRTSNDACCVF